MKFWKKILLTIATYFSTYLLSYAIGFSSLIGFPTFLINILNPILGVIVVSFLFKLFFEKLCLKNCSWLTYIPLALTMIVLCNIAVSIVGNISLIIREWTFSLFSYEIAAVLLNVVILLKKITQIILTYYFISVIEEMDLTAIDPNQVSVERKVPVFVAAIMAMKDYLVKCCAVSALTGYIRNNATRIIAFLLVLTLLIAGSACWGAKLILDNDLGFDNDRLVECAHCHGEGKTWQGTKGWLPCTNCGGTGFVGG